MTHQNYKHHYFTHLFSYPHISRQQFNLNVRVYTVKAIDCLNLLLYNIHYNLLSY